MTELSVGALYGTVELQTTLFDRGVSRVMKALADLGTRAEAATASTEPLDESLTAVGASADKASAGLGRATQSTTRQTAAAEKAAASARSEAAAQTRLAAIMADLAGASAKVRQATLRQAVAQDRMAATGSADFRRLAGAQAALIGSTRSLAAAQEEAAVAGGRFRTGMSSMLKTAGELGLLFGAFEVVKKAIDITKEAASFQKSMLLVQTQAGASAGQVAQFSKQILALAGPTATAPDDLATSLYHVDSALQKVGASGPQMLNTVKIAAEGAKVGMTDVEDTTNSLTATLASGVVPFNQAAKAMGYLNAVVGAGDMKFTDLNQALGTGLLVTMNTFGVSLKDTGAALAVYGDNNIRGADAATKLRMAVQDISKPAANADDVLSKVNLTTAQLRDSLEKGGLNGALQLLKTQLDAAGVTGNKVGGFLEDAFTKKAGAGLAILLTHMNQFDAAGTDEQKTAKNFGAAWTATTKTTAFAFDKMGATFESAGIVLAQKVGPTVAAAARWFASDLPHALATLQHAIGPTVSMIATGLVSAWHGLLDVLRPVASALGDVGHFLAGHMGVVQTFATGVAAIWVAFKGYAIARAAFRAISVGFDTMRAKALATGASVEAGMTVANIAIAGVGIVLAAGAYLWEQHAASVAKAKAEMQAYTDAVAQDNGVIGENTRLLAANTLQSNGVFAAANKLGLSLGTVTAAALGNKPAIDQIGAAYATFQQKADALTKTAETGTGIQADLAQAAIEGGGAISKQQTAWDKLRPAISGTNDEINKAIQSYKNVKAGAKGAADATSQHAGAVGHDTTATKTNTDVLQWNIDAHGRLMQTMVKSGSSLDNTTAAITRQTIASGLLKNALDALNGVNESVEQANDQLSIALGGLTDKSALFKDANGKTVTSLKQSTVAGATNRQMLVGIIDAAKNAAQAVADHAYQQSHDMPAALAKGNAALKDNEAAIRTAAAAAGLNADQVNTLIDHLGQLAKIKANPTATVDTSQGESKAARLQSTINAIKQGKFPDLKVGSSAADTTIRHLQQEIDNIRGRTIYMYVKYNPGSGPAGAKLNAAGTQAAYGRSTIPPNTAFTVGERGWEGGMTDSQGRASIFPAKAALAMGFKAPTGYANGTQTKAQQAAEQKAYTKASDALTGVSISKSGFSWVRFLSQIDKAAVAVSAAVRAGATAAQVASLRDRLHRDERRGDAVERALGRSIHGAANKLGGSLANLSNPASVGDVRGQLHTLEGLLRQAGLPKQFINGLDQENRHILALVKVRDQAARGLAKANSAMAAARAHEMNDYRSFAAASRGAFDITNPVASGKKITAGSLRAGQAQALTRVRQWVSGITKLAGKHIFPASYLRQLAGGGPTAENLATVQALLSMSGAGLRSFASQERQIAQLSGQGARVVAGRLNSHQLRVDDRRVQRAQEHLAREQERVVHAVENVGHEIVDELRHLHLENKIKGGDLVVILRHGQRDAKAHHRTGRNLVGS